jgi:hypothetical protein
VPQPELTRSQKFKNFFKRKAPTVQGSQTSSQSGGEPPMKKQLKTNPNIGTCDVWYKHQEKFTNAVKTRVTINDFF